MLRNDSIEREGNDALLPASPPDTATRCGLTKPLSDQTDDELVATFRAADLAKRQGANAALAAAFVCADVVAVFRERPNRLTFEQIARILGVEQRTAENYHFLYKRYPDRSKRPTDCSQRDLNVAFREVKKLMPGASKVEIAQAAAEKAKARRSERPAKKPRGRAARKAGGALSAPTTTPKRPEPAEPARMPVPNDRSPGPVVLPGTHVEAAQDAYARVMEAIDGVCAYLASCPPEEQKRSVVSALKDILRQIEAPRAAPVQPDRNERDPEDDADEEVGDLDAADDDPADPDGEDGDEARTTGDCSDDDDDDDDPDYEPDYDPGD